MLNSLGQVGGTNPATAEPPGSHLMLMRHRAGAIGRRAATAIASMGIALSVVATRASDQAVTWTDMVNVTAGGDVLQKTAGCDGCEDAGAASLSAITQGDG